jgi:hypothetical protein
MSALSPEQEQIQAQIDNLNIDITNLIAAFADLQYQFFQYYNEIMNNIQQLREQVQTLSAPPSNEDLEADTQQ